MAGYKNAPRQSANFKLANNEVTTLTSLGDDFFYLKEYEEEQTLIENWLDAADEAVSNNSGLPARPQLSNLGTELLQLLWPE